ncbi:MAG: hypothetical protein R2813_07515 [Flavobacteriales bacterium]
MAFNCLNYAVNGSKFPFLASTEQTIHQSIVRTISALPLILLSRCTFLPASFQLDYEDETALHVLVNILGYLSGNLAFIMVTAIYFITTS